MLIEIFHPSVVDGDSSVPRPVPDGEQGIVVQTSLQRLRNPLVRYITGDIGSLHPMPAAAGSIIPEAELKHFRVLRLVGRDPRFSFKWFGEYFEFRNIIALMQTVEFGILQWQVVLGHLGASPQPTLEIRVFRAAAGERLLAEDALVERLEKFFFVFPENRHLFRITFLDSLARFEKSSTGNKVMNFVDKTR